MDPLDMEILKEAAVLGVVYLKYPHQDERLKRLENEGFLYQIPPQIIRAGMPPAPASWKLTVKGKQFMTSGNY
jgi:hypothetical protein